MSTCPNKDIHSLFIDNELPEPYKSQFKTHINTCEQCENQQKIYQNIHSLLQNDKEAIFLSEDDIQNGYERLQAKLHYKRTIGTERTSPFLYAMQKSVPFVAAALLALAILPFYNTKNSQQSSRVATQTLTPSLRENTLLAAHNNPYIKQIRSARNKYSYKKPQAVMVQGNIPPESLSELFSTQSAQTIPEHSNVNVFQLNLPMDTMSVRASLYSKNNFGE